jgi:hypothetical protein
MTTTEGHDMPEPMTDERLEEIRGHDICQIAVDPGAKSLMARDLRVAADDRSELLAEVDRLRAELAETRRDRDDIATRFSARVVINEAIGELMDERDQLRAELKAAKSTDPRVTASAVLRHIAFWGDESRTREELLELADMIDRFEDGYCPLCQHICDPVCALYPVNAEAQAMESRKNDHG